MRLLHQVTAIMPIYLLYCQELKSQYRYFVGTAFFPKPKVPLIISTHYLQKSAFTVELGSKGGESRKVPDSDSMGLCRSQTAFLQSV
jgi:hypothetical protein